MTVRFLAIAVLSLLASVSPSAAELAPQGKPKPDAWWHQRLEAKAREIAAAGPNVDLVLLGDSITHGWDHAGALKRLREKYPVILPLGFNGDTLSSLTWRCANGELDGYKAKRVAVMIGTNDLGGGGRKPEVVFAAMTNLTALIRAKQPEAELVIQAVLPRDVKHREMPELWPNRIMAYNRMLKAHAAAIGAKFLCLCPQFQNADGTVKGELYHDRLHPNNKGYSVWADALLGDLEAGDCDTCPESRKAAARDAPPYRLEGGALANQLGRLTPPPAKAPRINAPAVYGVRPGHEIVYRIPVTGADAEVKVEGEGEGWSFDPKTRVLRGKVAKRGEYRLKIIAKNAFGTDEKTLTVRVGDKIALTPPMGWNSWNCFYGMVKDKNLRDAADRLVELGLADLGYQYVNMDAWWQVNNNPQAAKHPEMHGEARDAEGRILSNSKFPDMKALTEYIHAKGLKCGIYSSPGPFSCGGCECSWKHEYRDAARFAEWGFDYLKYDWCSYANVVRKVKDSEEKFALPYRLMGQALAKQDRDIVFSMSEYGMGRPWRWAARTGANLWRTTGDVNDRWERVATAIRVMRDCWEFGGPGAWNDPDMLVVKADHAKCRLTPNEQYTHLSMWCLSAAPLLIGCDLTKIDDFTLGLVSNAELIAIDQDELGAAAAPVCTNSVCEVWARPLADGDIAFGVFNPSTNDVSAAFDLPTALGMEGKWAVRDVWRQTDVGVLEGPFKVELPAHMTYVYRAKPAGGRLNPALTDVRNLTWVRKVEAMRPLVPSETAANSGPPGTVQPKGFKFSP